MSLPYRPLFHLENEALILIEIRRLDLPPTEQDPGRLYHWLLFDKGTRQLQKLDFESMSAGAAVQERVFRQGRLQFTAQAGTYAPRGGGPPLALRVQPPAALPAPLASAVLAYLRAQ